MRFSFSWNLNDYYHEFHGIRNFFHDHDCDTPNPGVPLTTRQPAEFLWILGDPIPHCCVPFIGIHIFTKK